MGLTSFFRRMKSLPLRLMKTIAWPSRSIRHTSPLMSIGGSPPAGSLHGDVPFHRGAREAAGVGFLEDPSRAGLPPAWPGRAFHRMAPILTKTEAGTPRDCATLPPAGMDIQGLIFDFGGVIWNM